MTGLKRILLAEDDLNGVELTLAALKEFNLVNDVQVVNDGEECLDYLYRRGEFVEIPNGNPAVLLLDLKMPKVGGLEVLETIRKDPKLKFIPVVIMTSSREESDRIASYELGTNAYIVKPIDMSAFVHAIRDVGSFWAIMNEPPPGTIPARGEH
jgi:CheY-like chemotaxis protein